jgi:hypothetical protein
VHAGGIIMSRECGQRSLAVLAVTVAMLGILAGLAMIVTSVYLTLITPHADPARDFSVLETECVITNVFHETTTESHTTTQAKTQTYCYDTYTYMFAWCTNETACAPSTAPSTVVDTTPRTAFKPSWSTTATEVQAYRNWWTSFPPPGAFANANWEPELLISVQESVSRGLGDCSSTQVVEPPTYNASDWVSCYQPTQLPVHETYQCGNAACIKVLDPAHDVAQPTRTPLMLATNLMYFGIPVTVCSCLCCLGMLDGSSSNNSVQDITNSSKHKGPMGH